MSDWFPRGKPADGEHNTSASAFPASDWRNDQHAWAPKRSGDTDDRLYVLRADLGVEIRVLYAAIAAQGRGPTDAAQAELLATRGVRRGAGHRARAELQVEEQRVRICAPEADLPGERDCVSVGACVARVRRDGLVLYCGKTQMTMMSRSSADVVAPVSMALIASRRSRLQARERGEDGACSGARTSSCLQTRSAAC
jgi:hypothetical protein